MLYEERHHLYHVFYDNESRFNHIIQKRVRSEETWDIPLYSQSFKIQILQPKMHKILSVALSSLMEDAGLSRHVWRNSIVGSLIFKF